MVKMTNFKTLEIMEEEEEEEEEEEWMKEYL